MSKNVDNFFDSLFCLGVIMLFIGTLWKVNDLENKVEQLQTKIVKIESRIDQINNWQLRQDEAEVYKMNYVKEE
jgi:hypothetical protein